MLRADALAGAPHGFSGRAGLEAEAILPGGTLVRARQIHSADVVTVERPFAEPPPADALVTDRLGLVLAIVTADCGPVLLADATAGVVGAAHAGWRGARAGVLENTLAAMARLGAEPSRVVAVIGPTIAQASYEIDAAMRAQFDPEDGRFFAPGARSDRWLFDLPGYIAARLVRAGVGRVADLARDTYAEAGAFHSYRRATHRGEPTGGRQTSAIARP